MSYEDDYWKQQTDRAEEAVKAAFEKADARYHLDANAMLGEAMRQCKGKNHPTVVHEVVVRYVDQKKAELKQSVEQQLVCIINGPLGLSIGCKQDIERLDHVLVTRVYENTNCTVPFPLLKEIVNEVIKACLEANRIPDYRDQNRVCTC